MGIICLWLDEPWFSLSCHVAFVPTVLCYTCQPVTVYVHSHRAHNLRSTKTSLAK